MLFSGFVSPTFSTCTSPKTPFYVEDGLTTSRATWTVPVAHDGQGKRISVVAVTGNGRPGDTFNIGVTTVVYKATDDNGLSSFCHVTFEVKVHTCSVPVVAHANRVCDRNNFIYGTTCQFTCIGGYTINGASQLTCEGGAWSPEAPTCAPMTCPSLDTFFSCTDGVNYGSICSVNCNVNAVANPRATFCLQNGSWYLPIPDCNATGNWIPTTVVPDCTVKRIPDEMLLEARMLFYTSSCETSAGKQQVEDAFLPLINSTTFFSNTDCVTSSCSVQDVTVACVTVNRRKRSPAEHQLLAPHNRYRRSETALEVTWYFGVNYICKNMTTDECVTYHNNVLNHLLSKVQTMLDNGHFNTTVAEGHVRNDSLSYLNANFKCEEGMLPVFETGSCAVCPKGTMYNNATSLCDLCPRGSYQNEDHSYSCKTCPRGTTSLDKGSTSRADCKAFEFSVNGDVNLASLAPATSEIYDFTLSLWYKATQLTSGTNISASGISIKLHLAQHLTVSVHGADMITDTIDLNKWTRFDVTFSSSSFVLTLYRDGKKVSDCIAFVTESSSKLSVSVGSRDAITIRSLSLYNTCKTPSEILQMASTCGAMAGDDSALSLDHMRTEGSGTITMMSPSTCIAVDECLTSPCNGHPCVDTPTSYECQCQRGYTGRNCSSPPDLCAHHQCQNMALCKSGDSNYTCECTEDFHGLLCQQRIVNGVWSSWRDWSACSVACGDGLRTRSRSCDSPPPVPEGKDCPGPATETQTCNTLDCPDCSLSQLTLGYGNAVRGPECNGSGGALDCRPVCQEGLFTTRHQITLYTCRGGYWTPSTKLPSCVRVVSPTTMSLTAAVNYTGGTCLTHSQADDLQTSLTRNLGRITCGQKSVCSIRVTVPDCNSESVTTVYSHFTVNLAHADLDLASYVHNKTLSPGLVAVVDAVEILEQTARQLQNTTTNVWIVASNGVTYSPSLPTNVSAYVICPPGTVPEDGLCGECPSGTSYNGVRRTCVPCVRGTYQVIPGQSFCRACPPGTTTQYLGATSAGDCTTADTTEQTARSPSVKSSTPLAATKHGVTQSTPLPANVNHPTPVPKDVASSNSVALVIVASVLGSFILVTLMVIGWLLRQRKKAQTSGSNEVAHAQGYQWSTSDEHVSPVTEENVYHGIQIPDNMPNKTLYYYHAGEDRYVPCDPDPDPDPEPDPDPDPGPDPDPDDLSDGHPNQELREAPDTRQPSSRVDGRTLPSFPENTTEFQYGVFQEETVTVDPYYQ
ncbi:sushi, von Willebrand factor type A, EGF and pentraxin domain-containing protein 1-like [Haliotis asinina]|uniref:sushi, von Willebrand factor type A, EGF and pentraxin domain-containing protein 1-like n=1 Tax=Haliotis asinina TaxID=109174 RepID=UPI00353208B7